MSVNTICLTGIIINNYFVELFTFIEIPNIAIMEISFLRADLDTIIDLFEN